MELLQDDTLAKHDVAELDRMKSERAPWEAMWRDIDERFPTGASSFLKRTPGAMRGERNFDTTHITALQRFAAAGVAITTPEEKHYIQVSFPPELMKYREVELWCQHASERLYAIRHASHTGFTVSANEDWRQLGRYGTSPVWSEAIEGRGLIYRALPLSECYIDVDAAGLVDTVRRVVCKTARQCDQLFGYNNLTPKMRDALDKDKPQTEFEILHTVCPNTQWDPDPMDWRAKPIASRFLSLDEKIYVRRGGFHTQPISVSRHETNPGEKYGRSPGTDMLPTIAGANAMRHTTLRAAHKAVDPALMFYDDQGITRLSTKPGGLIAGMVDDMGRPLLHRVPGGEAALPYAMQDLEAERGVIRTAFLEEFYKILTDPNSRMTTTEVLEVMAKQGVLVRPYAGRYAQEKQYPVTNRDLDLAMRAGQIRPFPAVVQEAGAWPSIDYENPLAAMARAEATGKTLRFVEALSPLAQVDPSIFDYLDTNTLVPGMAREIGVKPEYIRTPEDVTRIRQARANQQQDAQTVEQLQGAAGAYLDIAKANQLSEAA